MKCEAIGASIDALHLMEGADIDAKCVDHTSQVSEVVLPARLLLPGTGERAACDLDPVWRGEEPGRRGELVPDRRSDRASVEDDDRAARSHDGGGGFQPDGACTKDDDRKATHGPTG